MSSLPLARNGDVVRAVSASLRDRLPRTWTSDLAIEAQLDGARVDGLITIRSPDGARSDIVVEVKMSVQPRGVADVAEQARALALRVREDRRARPLVAAPFLSKRVRDALTAEQVNYADATGNLRLELARPAVFIEASGSDRDPRPEQRPLRSLKSPAAARVVRALFDARPPIQLGAIAQTADVSRAQTGRVAELLDREAVLTRDARGSVVSVDRTKLIERWVEDYSFGTANETGLYIEPRRFDKLLDRLREASFDYAVTGSLAARLVAEYAEARLGMIYVQSIERAADELGLRQVADHGNVVLAEPYDPVMLEGSWTQDGVRYAALGQVAADLLTSPGRGPAEGEELLRWLEIHREQ